MTLVIAGFRFADPPRRVASAWVWEGSRELDHQPVVARVFTIEAQVGAEFRLEHEFELLRRLELPGVVRVIALERSSRELVVIREAHPGVSLADYAGARALAVDEFLGIAAEVAGILADVHDQRVVHRDLKPSTILIDPETKALALADFGLSVALESERARIHEREVLERSLPYMAPEQTGRTGREVDYRSDLYALGVVFYELLTGRVPFAASTPLELIHALLARRPECPQRVRPELPTPVAQLVMKLLEKAPERRYQSARGLAHDLERLRLRGSADLSTFELGCADVPTMLRLPHQLYGRTRERAALLASFRRATEGTPSFVLLVGEPGIGKSALLDELVEPVLRRRGFLARGKFEPDSERPYAAIIAALSNLADQLLTETPDGLARWRERLRGELGGLAAIVCALTPRFALILGDQHPVAELAPIEARNQVRVALARLLGVFARVEHPLVLALDDLQWADPSSLELIRELLAAPQDRSTAMFVVGTARAELETDHTGILPSLLTGLAAAGREVLELELGPLSREALTELVADVLSRTPEQVASLVELVARKTGSNPLFARTFLLHLAELGLLARDPDGWTWDPDALAAASLPADALAMMTTKLTRLPEVVRGLLTVASVFGTSFDPAAVARVGGRAWPGSQLHQLIDAGLLIPLDQRGYAFTHDRIREAAYQLLGPQRRRALHLALGDDLLARLDLDDLDQRIFEVVDHLDRGYDLLGDEADTAAGLAALAALDHTRLRQLAQVNVRAGRRALGEGAPDSAVTYLKIGVALLERIGAAVGSEPDGASAFEATLAQAQAQALIGRYDEADRGLRGLLGERLGPRERGRVAVARIWALILAGDNVAAVRFGVATLRSLEVAVPEPVRPLDVVAVLPKMRRMARPEALERVCARPRIQAPRVLAALDVLTALAGTAYVTDPLLFVLLTERHGSLLEAHGDHDSAPQMFAQLGLVLANAVGRRREAVALARRCLELELRRRPGPECYRVRLTTNFASLWSEPFWALLGPTREVIDLAEELGDIESADYAWAMFVELSFYAGAALRLVADRAATRIAWAQRWGTSGIAGGGELFVRACELLREGPAPSDGDEDPLGICEHTQVGRTDLTRLGYRHLGGVILAVFGRWSEALREFESVGQGLESGLPGLWYSGNLCLLTGVAAAAVIGEGRAGADVRRLRRVVERQRKLATRWTAAGGNFEHVCATLEAEQARLAGELDRAARLYERARALASGQRNLMIEALICERTATLMIERELPRFAVGPLLDACELYGRWGAKAKVAQLEARWAELGLVALRSEFRTEARSPQPGPERRPGDVSTSRALDGATLVEIAQAIAEDIELADVVERVLVLAAESAGAERGALLLVDHDQLWVRAEWSADGDERGSSGYRELQATLASDHEQLPASLLRWVERTGEPVVLDEASADRRFASDPHFQRSGARSVLAAPIVKHGRLVGILYLENRLSGGSFTAARLEVLRLLTAQAASALENAQLYEALRASELRWRSLVEQLPDYVVLVDRHGKVEFVNRSARVDAEQIQRSPLELLTPESQRRAGVALAQLFATGGQQAIEVEGTNEDGSSHAFAVRMAPIMMERGVERAIVVASDISERKQLEAQIRQQQRLESIGTLAAGVAHEINNPVQGIMNYAELIAGSKDISPTVREFAKEIEHETERVATIVRNLLRFSRQEQHESLEQATPAAVVEGTVSLLRAVLRRSQIRLELRIPDDLPRLCCRPQQIQQVVMNLVTNARDALDQRFRGYHEHKRVDIEAEAFERDGAAWVRIRVSDQGGGVPEEVAARIYDPFFTTKGRDRGTGLGLAVSHGIVREHGGVLLLHNRPGVGASFVIELPGLVGPPQPA
jgi:PAS domain S-box-containing protein